MNDFSEKGVCQQEWRSTFCGVQLGRGSAESDSGVENEIGVVKLQEGAPTVIEECLASRGALPFGVVIKVEERGSVWNAIEVLLIEIEDGIEEWSFIGRNADRKCGIECCIKYQRANPC